MDYIDERNRKEEMAKSVIKRRNVIYTEPKQAEVSGEQESENKAQEILERLAEEQQMDEERKRKRIEELLEQQEKNQREIERILYEKHANLQKTMNEAGRQE